MAAVDVLMTELLDIARSSESDAVRLSAVNSALDRAGLGAKQFVDVAVTAKWDDTFEGGVVMMGDGTTDALSDDEAAEIKALNEMSEVETAKKPCLIRSGRGSSDEDDDIKVALQGVVVEPGDEQVMMPRRIAEALQRQGLLP